MNLSLFWDCKSDNLLVLLTITFIKYILVFAVLILLTFCKKNTEAPPDVGYDYAPLTLGKYIVYDIDSTVYGESGDTTYYKYRIKEKLEEKYTDNEGRTATKLVRYIKKYNSAIGYDNMSWTIKDVWMINKSNTTYEVVEEDVRFIKLTFPVKEEATWNGNAQNSLGERNYLYKYYDQKEAVNTTTFENVLYVEQKDDKSKNAIHREYFIEKYSRDVGLIYKEIKDLYSNTVKVLPGGGIMPVEQRIEKGIIYKMTYVTHGIE